MANGVLDRDLRWLKQNMTQNQIRLNTKEVSLLMHSATQQVIWELLVDRNGEDSTNTRAHVGHSQGFWNGLLGA